MVGLGEWSCGRCGTANASTDLFCGSCGAPAPAREPAASGLGAASRPPFAGPAPPASPNDGLRCQRCSGLNYGDATFCAVCGASLAGAPRVPIAPEPAVPYAPSAPTAGEGRRRRTWSIVLFVMVALLVIGAAVGAAAWVLLSGDDEGSDVAAVASPEPQATTTGAAASPVASPAATEATGDAEMLEFATALEDLMYESGEGRQDIIDAVNGFSSGSMSTSKAAGLIQGVIDNRNAVLDELAVLYVPNEQDADEMVRAFRKGIEFSVEADEYYLNWVYGSDAAYDEAGDAGTQAGRWKSDFVEMYNPVARRLGLRHDWKQIDI